MKERIEAIATAHAINMPHQMYIVRQVNVCRVITGPVVFKDIGSGMVSSARNDL